MVAEALESIRAALPAGVELVAVSKFHPVSRLMEAYDAGQRIFAESRPQELASKVPEMPSDVRWHFIGHLQTNKLKLVLPYVDLVQSVDSLHLLQAINTWGAANGRTINVLLELHLGAEQSKQGFSAEEILSLVRAGESMRSSERTAEAGSKGLSRGLIGREPQGDSRGAEPLSNGGWPGVFDTAPSAPSNVPEVSEGITPPLDNIRIRGLMGMATNTEDIEVVEKDFERIEALFLKIRSEHPELTDFDQLSIGMSGDWPVAVRHGATMVRIGTDIFGPREY